jgi:hypothetical protein
MDERVVQWLGDYVIMMEANLGALSDSKIPGLYQCVVERVVEIRTYLKAQGYVINDPRSAVSATENPAGEPKP